MMTTAMTLLKLAFVALVGFPPAGLDLEGQYTISYKDKKSGSCESKVTWNDKGKLYASTDFVLKKKLAPSYASHLQMSPTGELIKYRIKYDLFGDKKVVMVFPRKGELRAVVKGKEKKKIHTFELPPTVKMVDVLDPTLVYYLVVSYDKATGGEQTTPGFAPKKLAEAPVTVTSLKATTRYHEAEKVELTLYELKAGDKTAVVYCKKDTTWPVKLDAGDVSWVDDAYAPFFLPGSETPPEPTAPPTDVVSPPAATTDAAGEPAKEDAPAKDATPAKEGTPPKEAPPAGEGQPAGGTTPDEGDLEAYTPPS